MQKCASEWLCDRFLVFHEWDSEFILFRSQQLWGASTVIKANRNPSVNDSESGVKVCAEFLLSGFSQSLETALKYCNYFFSSTFVVEAMLKLIAFGFRRFFKDRWAASEVTHSSASRGPPARPFSAVMMFLCPQMESAGPGHRSAVCDGNHSGGDWNKRFAPHQSHNHPHHEGPAHRPRWARSLYRDKNVKNMF